jgi:hypothetical protein
LNFRGHPSLTIAGPYSKAKIAGTLKIADSLIYKDIEILPFGVPRTTEIPKPNLPSFSQSPRMEDEIISTPSGIMDWNVEIDITTKDPVLIRGNLIDGQIIGQNLKLRGTIGSPTTSGILITENPAPRFTRQSIPRSQGKLQNQFLPRSSLRIGYSSRP